MNNTIYSCFIHKTNRVYPQIYEYKHTQKRDFMQILKIAVLQRKQRLKKALARILLNRSSV